LRECGALCARSKTESESRFLRDQLTLDSRVVAEVPEDRPHEPEDAEKDGDCRRPRSALPTFGRFVCAVTRYSHRCSLPQGSKVIGPRSVQRAGAALAFWPTNRPNRLRRIPRTGVTLSFVSRGLGRRERTILSLLSRTRSDERPGLYFPLSFFVTPDSTASDRASIRRAAIALAGKGLIDKGTARVITQAAGERTAAFVRLPLTDAERVLHLEGIRRWAGHSIAIRRWQTTIFQMASRREIPALSIASMPESQAFERGMLWTEWWSRQAHPRAFDIVRIRGRPTAVIYDRTRLRGYL
jgi:hypothetical protein